MNCFPFYTIITATAAASTLSYASLPMAETVSCLHYAFSQQEATALLNEADDFIDMLNDGRQDRQADAIFHAIGGNSAELATLRNSRNSLGTLSDKVERTDIHGEAASRGVAMRLYRPKDSAGKQIPLLVYLHGGGWTIGSINSCASFCDELAASGNVMVLAVDYSLAPENNYPKGLFDCVSAVEYAFAKAKEWGSSPESVSIGGDSSGGNLALATCLYLQDDSSFNHTIKSLLLFYPVVKAYNDKSDSWKKYSRGYALDSRLMEAFNKAYIAEGDCHDPVVSPADATDDQLRKLPPMLIISAERDILCDQGKEFTSRVKNLGNNVERIEFPGAVHLFITVKGQPTAFNKAVALSGKFLKE